MRRRLGAQAWRHGQGVSARRRAAQEETALTKQERAQAYVGFLSDQGFRPTLDGDGDVAFKVEGYLYYIFFGEDEEFFDLVFPNFWPLESEQERARAEAAALRVTAQMKVAKVLPAKQGVMAAVEMFASSPESVFPVFDRALRVIQSGVRAFREEMRRADRVVSSAQTPRGAAP
jgi:hypothetical protein